MLTIIIAMTTRTMAEMLMTEIMKIKPSSTISPHLHNGIDDDNDNYDDFDIYDNFDDDTEPMTQKMTLNLSVPSSSSILPPQKPRSFPPILSGGDHFCDNHVER